MFWRIKKVPDTLEMAEKIVSSGNKYTADLEHMAQRVDTAKLLGLILRTQLRDIIATGRQIMNIAAQNAHAASGLRTFVDYYFPMTIKLAGAYIDSCDRAEFCDDSDAIVEKVRTVMDTIVDAFHKQLEAMIAAKKLDIKTDIEVLKQVIMSEGL